MKKDKDLTVYMCIENPQGTINMTAILYADKYVSPSIKLMHPTLGEEFWDNDEWIYKKLYPFLKRWESRTMSQSDIVDFKDELKIQEEDIVFLIDIIEKSIELGWFENSI